LIEDGMLEAIVLERLPGILDTSQGKKEEGSKGEDLISGSKIDVKRNVQSAGSDIGR